MLMIVGPAAPPGFCTPALFGRHLFGRLQRDGFSAAAIFRHRSRQIARRFGRRHPRFGVLCDYAWPAPARASTPPSAARAAAPMERVEISCDLASPARPLTPPATQRAPTEPAGISCDQTLPRHDPAHPSPPVIPAAPMEPGHCRHRPCAKIDSCLAVLRSVICPLSGWGRACTPSPAPAI